MDVLKSLAGLAVVGIAGSFAFPGQVLAADGGIPQPAGNPAVPVVSPNPSASPNPVVSAPNPSPSASPNPVVSAPNPSPSANPNPVVSTPNPSPSANPNPSASQNTPCTAQELTEKVNVSAACSAYLLTLNPPSSQKDKNNGSGSSGDGPVTFNQLKELAQELIGQIKGTGVDFRGSPVSGLSMDPDSIRQFLQGDSGKSGTSGSGSSSGLESLLSALPQALSGLMGGNSGIPFTNGSQNPFSNAQNPFTSGNSFIPQSASDLVARSGNQAAQQVSSNALNNISQNVTASLDNLAAAETALGKFTEKANEAASGLEKAKSALDKLDTSGGANSKQNELEALKAILEASISHAEISQAGFESTVGAINANGQAITNAVMAGNQVAMAQLEAMGAMSTAQNAQLANLSQQMARLAGTAGQATRANPSKYRNPSD